MQPDRGPNEAASSGERDGRPEGARPPCRSVRAAIITQFLRRWRGDAEMFHVEQRDPPLGRNEAPRAACRVAACDVFHVEHPRQPGGEAPRGQTPPKPGRLDVPRGTCPARVNRPERPESSKVFKAPAFRADGECGTMTRSRTPSLPIRAAADPRRSAAAPSRQRRGRHGPDALEPVDHPVTRRAVPRVRRWGCDERPDELGDASHAAHHRRAQEPRRRTRG